MSTQKSEIQEAEQKPQDAAAAPAGSVFDNVQSSARDRMEHGQRAISRLEFIEAWLNTQFQPLVFSVESNPVLGDFMRQYTDSLRDQTRYIAHLYSDMVGHQEALADSYWLAAQKYVDSIGVWARALSASQEKTFEDLFRTLKEAVPPETYHRKVAELAEKMWMSAGHGYLDPLDIWVSAENHMLTIAARSIANAVANTKTTYEAIENLRREFEDFVAVAYLAGIRQRAFYLWKAHGEPSGQALNYWLEAERQTLTLGHQRQAAKNDRTEVFSGGPLV